MHLQAGFWSRLGRRCNPCTCARARYVCREGAFACSDTTCSTDARHVCQRSSSAVLRRLLSMNGIFPRSQRRRECTEVEHIIHTARVHASTQQALRRGGGPERSCLDELGIPATWQTMAASCVSLSIWSKSGLCVCVCLSVSACKCADSGQAD